MPADRPYAGESFAEFQQRKARENPLGFPIGLPGMTPGISGTPRAGESDVMDPALRDALLGTFGDQTELEAMEKQMAQAEALRGLPTPEGIQGARVYTAASPLSHIGIGMQRWQGARRAKTLEEGTGGYAPGEEAKATPEQLGMRGLRKRRGENVAKYGKNIPGV